MSSFNPCIFILELPINGGLAIISVYLPSIHLFFHFFERFDSPV